jgi:hypothetical protein
MTRHPLVVLLLLAATLGYCCAEAYYKEPGKGPRQHHKKDAKRDYTHKAAEQHQQAQQHPSYDLKEQQHECKDDCPNPQPADSVSNGELCVLPGPPAATNSSTVQQAAKALLSKVLVWCSPHAAE